MVMTSSACRILGNSMVRVPEKKLKLLHNLRFYVLVGSLLCSAVVVAGLRLVIASDQLWLIRVEQVFGLLAVLYLYTALLISPLAHVFGKARLRYLVFARRAIGVSAAYFALLHGGFALWGQLGGLSALAYLPIAFQWSFAAGAAGLAVVLVMAATSFDAVVQRMTYRSWKLLHRTIYVGSFLILLHVWMVGTHVSYGWVQLTGFLLLALLLGLEAYRIAGALARRFTELRAREYFITVAVSLWVIGLALLISVPALVQNYHSARHDDHTAETSEATHE